MDFAMAITEWSDDILVVDLQEEPLLSDELALLYERLSAAASAGRPGRSVVLNFEGVGFVNSSNLGQVLRLRQAVVAGGGELRLCGLNRRVRSIVEVTHLHRLLAIDADMPTALASVQLASRSPGEAE